MRGRGVEAVQPPHGEMEEVRAPEGVDQRHEEEL
jgi:hypothetical protein